MAENSATLKWSRIKCGIYWRKPEGNNHKMLSLTDFLSQKIARRSEEGLLRQLKTTEGLIDFTSNDYLGLARSEALFDLIQEKVESLPKRWNGATGSRLLSGN